MSKLPHVAGSVGVGLFAVTWVALAQPPKAGRVEDIPDGLPGVIVADPPPAAVGSLSCAGQGCHGQVVRAVPKSAFGATEDELRWRSSYTVWRAYDRHTRAFAVLKEERSVRMVDLLSRGVPHPPAQQDARCLACHANPGLAARTDDRGRVLHAEGVGCEACHGNAGRWLNAHTGWPAGPDHTAHARRDGMTDLNDVAVRAETCAGCHVGGPGRDMNHDLIAAGHPRLNFDYATYLAALPPHWAERDRGAKDYAPRPASDEVRHWLVGRAAGAVAACDLLADRARRSGLPADNPARAPWPELAEFHCFACHHDLGGPAGRTLVAEKPGSIRWHEPPLWDKVLSMGERDEDPLARLSETNLRSSAAEARNRAGDGARRWRKRAHTWAGSADAPPELPKTPAELRAALTELNDPRWEEASQAYYGLLALERADRGLMDPAGLGELRKALVFPRPFNSPRGYDPPRVAKLFAGLGKP